MSPSCFDNIWMLLGSDEGDGREAEKEEEELKKEERRGKGV